MHTSFRIRVLAAPIAVFTGALILVAGAAAGRCTTFSGAITSSVYYPPSCLSEVGVCQHELLSGSRLVTGDVTFHTFGSASDPADPTRYEYTTSHIFTLHGGAQLLGQDTGDMHIVATSALAPFESTSVISGGTRRYRNATGTIHLTGNLDLTTGLASGSYDGTVCR